MHPLAELLTTHESWLMHRVRDYALAREYTRFTSTLVEAWRVSIVGLTDSIVAALAISDEPWELGPEDDFVSDPVAAFGVLEAQRHRARGVTLEMFMGLMKYYRLSYLDLIRSTSSPFTAGEAGSGTRCSRFVECVFDRIEIAFCAEWSRTETVNRAIDELQVQNRLMTNEKNKFLTIFESLPLAVFLLDEKARIVHMNQSAARLLDPAATAGGYYYSAAEERVPFPWLRDELASFGEHGEEREYEQRITPVGGEERWVLARFRPMQDISLKFEGTVVIFKDITQRKRMEEELILAQAHLSQQEKMSSIGQLAAGVAHEINNPMGFISSNLSTLDKYLSRLNEFIAAQDRLVGTLVQAAETEGLRELRKRLKIDYITSDARQLIAESLEGSGRVRRIVQDLKSFARVDKAECGLVNLNETLETTINIASNEIKYVAVVNRELGDIPQVRCYPQQLNQVFLNLLVNAAQAIEGRGTITVRTWSDGESVQVSVTDTGKGIPEEIKRRIFEPFFTTKEVGKGTGLGLSISYDIVHKHGGEITVESVVGQGTTFTVRLPFDG